MLKSYEVTSGRSAHSFGFYSGTSPDEAIRACVNDAGYESAEAMESATGAQSTLRAQRIVCVPADPDQDDCLAAAAQAYADQHGLEGWDLAPRWEDETREAVILSIPESA
ncbi:MAG: hypothetical protein RIQ53_4182 [Pseudomonadota bacterium]